PSFCAGPTNLSQLVFGSPLSTYGRIHFHIMPIFGSVGTEQEYSFSNPNVSLDITACTESMVICVWSGCCQYFKTRRSVAIGSSSDLLIQLSFWLLVSSRSVAVPVDCW